MSSTFDTVANIISETCDIERDKIKPESHAIDDLGIDSLDFLDIAFAIELEPGQFEMRFRRLRREHGGLRQLVLCVPGFTRRGKRLPVRQRRRIRGAIHLRSFFELVRNSTISAMSR